MSSIIDYIRKRRLIVKQRQETRFNTNENFVNLENINKGDFSLSKDKIEFFYPVSKNHVNWGYEKDHMTIAAKADRAFLKKSFPVKRPELETYFEEREKIALFDNRFALRFPALYYLSKLFSFFPKKNYFLF